MSNIYKNYNPDILETIANLSNDEVFTPPELANEILDLLPEEVWSNPNLTFLDPAVKTGIFLREIASRLIDGLADQIPDLQERVNHILTKQVFGIGITELTTLMARRTVYCSTTANGEFSICTEFDDEKGNIILPDTEHTWDKNGRCEFCGANEENYSGGGNKENYAYPFIHDNFEKEFGNMKFDVIIGNPPYQLSVGNEGANASRSGAIYNNFIDKALEMNPKYISMITPSRWMTNSALGISSEWVKNKLSSGIFKIMVDYEDAREVFPSVNINGGVNYFLIDSKYKGKCNYTHIYENGEVSNDTIDLNALGMGLAIRDLNAMSIIRKIEKIEGKEYWRNNSFSEIVSPSGYYQVGKVLTTSWRDYSKVRSKTKPVKYYVSESTNGVPFGWINKNQIPRNSEIVEKRKVFIPFIHGGANQVLGNPIYGEEGSICSQTYITIGYKNGLTIEEAHNTIKYISTKFFRFLVRTLKKTQMGSSWTYSLVPISNINFEFKDEKDLYEKYCLTDTEIDYINKVVSEMDVSIELERIQEEIDYIEDNIDPMPTSDD